MRKGGSPQAPGGFPAAPNERRPAGAPRREGWLEPGCPTRSRRRPCAQGEARSCLLPVKRPSARCTPPEVPPAPAERGRTPSPPRRLRTPARRRAFAHSNRETLPFPRLRPRSSHSMLEGAGREEVLSPTPHGGCVERTRFPHGRGSITMASIAFFAAAPHLRSPTSACLRRPGPHAKPAQPRKTARIVQVAGRKRPSRRSPVRRAPLALGERGQRRQPKGWKPI